MKIISFFLIFILLIFSSCKTKKTTGNIRREEIQAQQPATDVVKEIVNFHDQSTWLLGYFSKDQLVREPYSSWYLKGYDEYQFNSEAVNKLTDIGTDGLAIKIVMGTWCPDSRREVPRFMRIIDLWHFPISRITFIGVDDAKLSPVGEYEKLNIQRVPTFIIYQNNIEAGRIIENPSTSLEQDIINILNKK